MQVIKLFATVATLLAPLVSSTTVPAVSLQAVVFVAPTANTSSRPIICIQGMDCFELGEPVAHDFNGTVVTNTTAIAGPQHVGSSGLDVGAAHPADEDVDAGDVPGDDISGFVCFGTCCTRCYENSVRLFNRRRLDALGQAANGTQVASVPREYGLECSPLSA